MTKTPTKPAPRLLEDGIEPRLYNDVVDSASLVTIQLRKHDFDVAADFYNLEVKKKLAFDKVCLGCNYDTEMHIVAGSYRFTVSAKTGRKQVLKSVAEYLVVYEFDQPVDEAAATAFCKRIGLYASYPYYRSLVSTLSSAANLNLPTLPMMATRGSRLPLKATQD